MIIDEKEVIIGSFNFTNATQNRNVENVVSINFKIIYNLFYRLKKIINDIKESFS